MGNERLQLPSPEKERVWAERLEWYKTYCHVFGRVSIPPYRLDEDGFRQWDERFVKLGKVIAWLAGLAKRLNAANLVNQNRHLKTAVLLLQAATSGRPIAGEFQMLPKTRSSFHFVGWLPFVRDALFPPAEAREFSKPPNGCSQRDLVEARSLFDKRLNVFPRSDKGHVDYVPPAWMNNLSPESLLHQCYELKKRWRLPEEAGVYDANQEIRELKAGLAVIGIDTPTALPILHGSFLEVIRASPAEDLRLFDDFHASVDQIIAAIKGSNTFRPSVSSDIVAPPPEKKPEKFTGGVMVFFEDRVELCGADICSGPRSRRLRRVLELLRVPRSDGKFMSYSGQSLQAELGKNIPGLIRDLRESIRNALEKAGIEVENGDVITSSRTGYHFSQKLTVQLKDGGSWPANASSSVPNVPDGSVPGVPNRDVPNGDRCKRLAWILDQLTQKRQIKTVDVMNQFGCAEKTAKRDLKALRSQGKIEFVGTRRSGFYRLCQAPGEK